MKKRNTEFRKEMEETSARVMEMVELIPVTRAHALEEEEVTKMSGQLFAVPGFPGCVSVIHRI